MVEFDDERDAVRVLTRHGTQHTEGARDGVAAAFERQLDDVLGVEIVRVLCEGCARRVLDALIDRQDRQVARACQSAMIEQRLQTAEHLWIAIRM